MYESDTSPNSTDDGQGFLADLGFLGNLTAPVTSQPSNSTVRSCFPRSPAFPSQPHPQCASGVSRPVPCTMSPASLPISTQQLYGKRLDQSAAPPLDGEVDIPPVAGLLTPVVGNRFSTGTAITGPGGFQPWGTAHHGQRVLAPNHFQHIPEPSLGGESLQSFSSIPAGAPMPDQHQTGSFVADAEGERLGKLAREAQVSAAGGKRGRGAVKKDKGGPQTGGAVPGDGIDAGRDTNLLEDAPASAPPAKNRGGRPPKSQKRAAKKAKVTEEEAKVMEEGKRVMWKDIWIVKLIAARIRRDADFNKTRKQGVDLWAEIALEIVSECPDFDKDAEACRQKFKKIMKDYQADKAQNAKSGSNRGERCAWFSQMDEFFATKASVECVAHASASGIEEVTVGGSESVSKSTSRKQKAVSEIRSIVVESQEEVMNRMEAIEERKIQVIKDAMSEVSGLLKLLIQSNS